jgi:hypothetical protein
VAAVEGGEELVVELAEAGGAPDGHGCVVPHAILLSCASTDRMRRLNSGGHFPNDTET